MKKTLLFLAIALFGIASAPATCWRINPSPYAGAQFKTVEEAMNDINVLPGDTLLLDPGKHGAIAITRDSITVIGSGYFLDQNKQWSESQVTILSNVSLGYKTTIEGCIAKTIDSAKGAHIKRCKFEGVRGLYPDSVTVEQCHISGHTVYMGPAGITDVCKHWIIKNNIVDVSGGRAIDGAINTNGVGSIIENNVLISDGVSVIGNIESATIRNNIIINTRSGSDNDQIPYAAATVSFTDNNNIQNNVFSTPESYANAQYPNNYFVGATIENTFVNEGSEDGKWQLLDTSAAKHAATHGGDCGVFGGPTPYVLSGIPQFLPHITEALVPAKPTDGKITVKLKIANQNE